MSTDAELRALLDRLATERLIPAAETLAGRLEGLDRWRRELGGELAALPDTLRRFREGVANFHVVSQRLAGTTEALERVQQHVEATGLVDAARRLDEATSAVERQVAAVRAGAPGFERAEAAVAELNKTLTGMAERLPWWGGKPPWSGFGPQR